MQQREGKAGIHAFLFCARRFCFFRACLFSLFSNAHFWLLAKKCRCPPLALNNVIDIEMKAETF
jgi:hypothetical protein